MHLRRGLTLLAVLLACGAAGARDALAGNVRMQVTFSAAEVGQSPGRWTTATIEFVGDSKDRDLTVSMQALAGPAGGCVAEFGVLLPANAKARLEVPLYSDWFHRDWFAGEPAVRVFARDQERRELVGIASVASLEDLPLGATAIGIAGVSLRSEPERACTVAIVGDAPLLANLLDDADQGSLAKWRAEAVPTHLLGFDSFALVVLVDPAGLALSSAASDALENWVLAGGHVLLAGLQNRVAATAFPLAGAIPWASEPAWRTAGEFFPDLEDGPAGDQRVRFTGLRAAAGVALMPELPLAVRMPHGFGHVTTLALLPDSQELAAQLAEEGLPAFVLPEEPKLKGQDNPRYPRSPALVVQEAVRGWVTASPRVRALPWWLIVLGLVGLGLWIGPGEYLILKRMGRLRLTWISLPVVLIGSSLLLLGMAYRLAGDRLIVNAMHLVSWDPAHDHVSGISWTAHFPGASGDKFVVVPPGDHVAVAPLSVDQYYYGGRASGSRSEAKNRPEGRVQIKMTGNGFVETGTHLRMHPELSCSFAQGAGLLAGLEFVPATADAPAKIANRGTRSWVVYRESASAEGAEVGSLAPKGELELVPALDEAQNPLVPKIGQAGPGFEQEVLLGASSRWLARLGLGVEAVKDQRFGAQQGGAEPLPPPAPELQLPAGIHAWDGRLLQSEGRTLVVLVAEAGADPVQIDRKLKREARATTVVRVLVPEDGR